MPTSRLPSKKAVEARKAFSEERRREIVTNTLERVYGVAQKTTDPQNLQRLAVAIGILVDKDLLLAGKPTNISESRSNKVPDYFSKAEEEWKS